MKKVLFTICVAAASLLSGQAFAGDLDCKKLLVSGEINEGTFTTVHAATDCLDNGKETILTINSGGGDTDYGFGSFDLLFEHPNRKLLTTIGYGQVASAAVPIFLAGEKRLLSCNSFIFVHEPFSEVSGTMSIKDTKWHAVSLAATFNRSVKIQAMVTKMEMKKMAELLSKNTSLEPHEAIKLKFATGTTVACQ